MGTGFNNFVDTAQTSLTDIFNKILTFAESLLVPLLSIAGIFLVISYGKTIFNVIRNMFGGRK